MRPYRDDGRHPMKRRTTKKQVASAFRRRRWLVGAVVAYLVLLAVSHVVRLRQPDPWPAPPGLHSIDLPADPSDSHIGDRPATAGVVIRYIDTRPDALPETPVVLLIHGGAAAASSAFPPLAGDLGKVGRVLAPDLPGFGFSTRRIDDFGFAAQAEVLQCFLDRLRVKRVHLVAYGMGGGAALRLAADQPGRIASLTLVSAVGVQELELMGDYHMNHVLHGLQLAVLWALQECTPHMGLLDRWALNTNYARNLFDADQRPLRGMLHRIDQPTLILHGVGDNFVPLAAAREHARLLPQSRLKTLPGGHGLVFQQAARVARLIARHIQTVESGEGRTRANAQADRLDQARVPFGRLQIPAASGLRLLIFFLLIALATLVSEDLTCIGAGMMAARGMIGYLPAAGAAFLGIVVGDLLLYAAGRFIGRPALPHAPLRWFIKPDEVARATRWLEKKGPAIIIASRFLPGTRLPVYFTAGVLSRGVWTFLFYFCVAAALWTPALVGLSMWAGDAVMTYYAAFHHYLPWVAATTMLVLWTAVRFCVPLLSFKGRRLLLSRYKRLRHWEFWPLWFFYIPIVGYILYLGMRFRHWTLFTAANPAIPAGGIVGESKSDILSRLSACGQVAPFVCVRHNWTTDRQVTAVLAFMADHRIDFPVICKPDAGERGNQVQSVATVAALRTYLDTAQIDTIVQQYVPGKEFGVFYYRYPGEKRGRIFAITDKRLPSVTGDGRHSLEHLILSHPRAVCQARLHLAVHRDRLDEIPPAGEKVRIVTVGTHCRGALFLDGRRFITPQLTRAFDAVSRHFEGFYFGRYDVRTEDPEAFMAGGAFKILELNGVTSEATHIYDPANSLGSAWKTLMRQWKIAFEIGEANRQRGATTLTAGQFFKLVFCKRP
jgi:pimeloyl-ACP methyl ester carboxylesterase/membrane protein DedA with SNARE-associated domain